MGRRQRPCRRGGNQPALLRSHFPHLSDEENTFQHTGTKTSCSKCSIKLIIFFFLLYKKLRWKTSNSHLKQGIQWHLVYSQCESVSSFKMLPSHQSKVPYPLSSFSPYFLPPPPTLQSVLILSLWIYLFWILHIPLWLASSASHILEVHPHSVCQNCIPFCGWIIIPFITNIPELIYPFIHWWTFGLFPPYII